MNYSKIYTDLVLRAKSRKTKGYTESHHIKPRCIGGTDEKDNLVKLTAREHFIAHLLLSKIYPEETGLILAIQMMCVSSNSHSNERINNRMYSWLKEKFSKVISKQQMGEGNSQFGTMWIYNLELKESKKIKKEEFFTWEQDGWIKGRRLNFEKLSIEKNCLYCNSVIFNKNYCSNNCVVQFKKENGTYINPFKNKQHSELTKKKMKNHTRNNGENNPMFGMKYIHNPKTLEYKRCKDEILNQHLNNGWEYGMKPR